MKKRIFKFGAALTAALMVFSATASLAFADEPEVTEADVETAVTDAIVPEEAAEEVTEVVVPVATEEITAEDAAAEAAAATADVPTGSEIAIGEITSSSDADYYTVSVPFTVTNAPSQMSFFVYDISKIAGDQNNTVGFAAETPVGYINQYAGAASGTYTFKLAKSAGYADGSIIVVKIGGTGVTTPDAKSYTLTSGGSTWLVGDANHSGAVDNDDAILVMRYALGAAAESDLFLTEANANSADPAVNNDDAISIMKYALGAIQGLPE